MMGYERGERKELGHIQGISRALTHEGLKERIRRWMRLALLLASGMYRAKIGFVFVFSQAKRGSSWADMSKRTKESRIIDFSRTRRLARVRCLFFSRMPIVPNRLFAN